MNYSAAKENELYLVQKGAWVESGIGDFMKGLYKPGLAGHEAIKKKAIARKRQEGRHGFRFQRRTEHAARQRAQDDGQACHAGLHPSPRSRAGLSLRALRRVGRDGPVCACRFPRSTAVSAAMPSTWSIIAEEMSRKSFDFFTAYGGSVFCGLNVARKGSRGAEALLDAEAAVRRHQDVDLDVGARCRLRRRRDADHRAPRRRRMGHQRPEALGDGRGARKNNVINVYVKTDPTLHYRKGMSLFLVDERHAGARSCASSTCSAAAASAPTRFSSTMCAYPPTLVGGENSGWDVRAVRLADRAHHGRRRLLRRRSAVVDLALAVRQGPQAVRPSDRHVPGDRPHAGGHADRGGGRSDLGLARRLDGRQRAARMRCGRSPWPSCLPRRPM